MEARIHKYPLVILERHLDTFGHVNNATYLELFEEARWDWIHHNGYGLSEIRRTRQGPTILEIQIRFKRELKNRTAIVIETFLEAYESKVGQMVQRMVDAEKTLYCEAKLAFGLFDLDQRRLVPPTEAWLRAVGISKDSGT